MSETKFSRVFKDTRKEHVRTPYAYVIRTGATVSVRRFEKRQDADRSRRAEMRKATTGRA